MDWEACPWTIMKSIDLSDDSDPVEIPNLDKCQSRIGDIRKVNNELPGPALS